MDLRARFSYAVDIYKAWSKSTSQDFVLQLFSRKVWTTNAKRGGLTSIDALYNKNATTVLFCEKLNLNVAY